MTKRIEVVPSVHSKTIDMIGADLANASSAQLMVASIGVVV